MTSLGRRPRPGDRLELSIEELTAEGLGSGTVIAGEASGQTRRYRLEVPGALPGERVQVVCGPRRGRQMTARLEHILEARADRVLPRCRHHARAGSPLLGCGGCSLQSLSYPSQLRLKHERVCRLIAGVGLDPQIVAPPLAQAEPWFHRNKMEYTFHPPREGGVVLGLHPAGSRQVLQLAECFLLSPFASSLLQIVADWANELGLTAYWPRRNSGFLRTFTIREGKRTAERLVDLTTSADEMVEARNGPLPALEIARSLCVLLERAGEGPESRITSFYWTRQVARAGEATRFEATLLRGSPVLHEVLRLPAEHLLSFEIHPRAFFQPVSAQAEQLYAQVLRAAELGAGRDKLDAFDLYCGTGTIALCLAPFCRQVTGVELQADAVENARRNALRNGIENVRFIAGDVGAVLARGEALSPGERPDLVVVDPPRSGLAAPALAHVRAIGAARLVYVSCNPEALARDLLELARYGYAARQIQPVDMFPHTAHIECVAQLLRD